MAVGPAVLVVEDEFITATDMKSSLTDLGYEVAAVVDSGEEAVRVAGLLRPDVVLMDIVLAGPMGGIQAASEIREKYRIPVLFVTAHSDGQTLEMAKIAGPFGYIVKPFEALRVRVSIEMALGRHALEEKIRRSEEAVRALLDATRDEIVLVDHEGTILALNSATGKRAGKPPSQLVNTHVSALIPRGTITTRTGELNRLLSDGRVTFEEEDHGRCFDTSIYTVPDSAGDLSRVAIYRHDVTELKLAEDEIRLMNRQLLKERERLLFLTTALDTLSDSVVITDHAGKITYVNTTFERKSGFPAGDVTGKAIGDLAHPGNTVNLTYDFFQAFWGADWTGTFLMQNSAGAGMPMAVRGKPILYENNRPKYFVFVLREKV